jgi:hypothetical protein
MAVVHASCRARARVVLAPFAQPHSHTLPTASFAHPTHSLIRTPYPQPHSHSLMPPSSHPLMSVCRKRMQTRKTDATRVNAVTPTFHANITVKHVIVIITI